MWQAKPIDLDPDLVVDGSALSILINSGSSNCALAAESKVKPVKPDRQWRPYTKAAETVQPAAVAKATPSAKQTTLSQHMRKGPTSSSESPIGSMSSLPNLDADTAVAIPATQLQEESQPASKRGCHRQTASVDPTDAAASLAAASLAAVAAGSTAAATATKPAPRKTKKGAPKGPAPTVPNRPRYSAHPPASAEAQRKYGGKEVRIPHAMFDTEPKPASGYWVATVGNFADAKKTVWLTISGESPFWRYSKELCELELHA